VKEDQKKIDEGVEEKEYKELKLKAKVNGENEYGELTLRKKEENEYKELVLAGGSEGKGKEKEGNGGYSHPPKEPKVSAKGKEKEGNAAVEKPKLPKGIRKQKKKVTEEDEYFGPPKVIKPVSKESRKESKQKQKEEEAGAFVIPAKDLKLVKRLGKGQYGVVYLMKMKGVKVAVKEINEAGREDEGKLGEFLAEAGKMKEIPNHPNIVAFFGVCKQPLRIVIEYLNLGSLDEWLRKEDGGQSVDEEVLIDVIMDIARGMSHLHTHNFIHRDLAARNVLLEEKGGDVSAKIADYGFSRKVERSGGGKTESNIGPLRF